MTLLDRDAWRRRQEAFARFSAWEEELRARRDAAEEEQAVEAALAATQLWLSLSQASGEGPEADLEKVRGIAAMRAALARVRFPA